MKKASLKLAYVRSSSNKLVALNPSTLFVFHIVRICGILQITHNPTVVTSQNQISPDMKISAALEPIVLSY